MRIKFLFLVFKNPPLLSLIILSFVLLMFGYGAKLGAYVNISFLKKYYFIIFKCYFIPKK